MDTPSSCEVLVIGGGPAGAAAARVLAAAGRDVHLVDRSTFPRDKVCGDGLISDAIGALRELGLEPRVRAAAVHASELRLYAPSGRHVPIRGEFACLPRARLDALLVDAAREAGARFVPGLTAIGPLEDRGRVVGARFRSPQGEVAIRARFTMLATGTNATTLDAFGFVTSKKPDAVAGRAYFEAPEDLASRLRHLSIVYHREWCPGYGWVFPGPGNRFNVGVGLFAGARRATALRDFWSFFLARFEPAREIATRSIPVVAFRGAPLRTGLRDAAFGREGLLAIGETVAVTYPATGEGIGKSMESGLLAAHMLDDVLTGRRHGAGIESAYRDEFGQRFAARYAAYATAQRWARSPLVLDLLAGRAARGRFVRDELEALVAERGDASELFSTFGLMKALVR